MKKCVESGEDVQSALVDYCNTPVVDGLTPAQILMNRRLRTKVPIAKKLLKPSLCDPSIVKQKVVENHSKSSEHYNKTSKLKANFNLGDLCMFIMCFKVILEPGKIVGLSKTPKSYVDKIESSGSVLRRNSFHLRLRKSILTKTAKHI